MTIRAVVGDGTRQALIGRRLSVGAVRDYGIVLALLLLFVALTFSSDIFLTQRNLLNILDEWSPVAIMALGGTFVLLAGGFDLSIGGIFAVSGIIAAQAANGSSVELGFLAGIAIGFGLGLANGLLVTVGRMNPFVATIGTSIVYSGLAAVITSGYLVQVTKEGFDVLAQTSFLNAKLSVYFFAAAIAVSSSLLNLTSFGRYVRAIGANSEAARLSGVRVDLVRASTYALSGLGGGLAGVLVVSKSLSANPGAGTSGIQFNVWAALLLGGNSVFGGVGAVWRTVVGVLLLALIQNGFNLLNVDPLWQQIATGLILLWAVALDAWARRRGV